MRKRSLRLWITGFAAVGVAILFGLWQLDRFQGNRYIRLNGRVVDVDGGGVPGITVSAKVTERELFYIPIPWGDTGNIYNEASTTTDDNGNFVLVSKGYRLSVAPRPHPQYLMPWEIGAFVNNNFDFDPGTQYPPPDGVFTIFVRKKLEFRPWKPGPPTRPTRGSGRFDDPYRWEAD